MKIPIIRATEEMKQIPVTATTKGAGRTWDAIGRLGEDILNISTDIAARQTNIRIATNTAQAENDLEAFNMDTVNELRKTANPETYYQEWANKFIPKVKELVAQAKGPRERAAIELRLNQIGQRELVEQKYYANKLSIETAIASRDQSLINYANQGKLKEGLDLIEATKDLDGPKKNLQVKEDYQAFFDKRQVEIDKARAIEAIRIDPRQAYMDFHDPNYLPHITGVDREQYKNNALSASKILENEQEAKIKEAKVLLHDNKMREVEGLIRQRKFSEALAVSGSDLLTAPEQRQWREDIEKASQQLKIVIDPNVELANMVKLNDMIASKDDPFKIRRTILTAHMKPENKEQWLLKMESNLSAITKEGRDLGYKDIQDIIIPKKVGLSLTNLVQSPRATQAIALAEMDFDEWIDQERKANRYHTLKEMRLQAQSFARDRAPSLADSIMDLEAQAKEQVKAIREIAEEKKKKK